METKLRVLMVMMLVILTGCAPATGSGSNPDRSTAGDGAVPLTQRATQPAVQALSTLMPTVDGLYFTSDLLVTKHGQSARLLAGLPCSQVVDLLSSGEWRLTKNIPVNPAFGGLIPGLTLMERNDEYLLLKSKEILPESPDVFGGQQAATTTPNLDVTPGAVDYGSMVGCQVNIVKINAQPIEAHGVEEVQGTALGFPLIGECLSTADQTQVSMFYEGPGDFRAMLKFDTPNSPGEHPLTTGELNLQIIHFPESVLDFVDQYLSQWKPGETSSLESQGTAFSAGADSPGNVTILSQSPLTGEIQLDNMLDPSGSVQTFKAAFDCGW